MNRCLIVANRTLGGQQLLDHVRASLDAGPARFQVLVPVPPGAGDDERAEADERMARELQRLRALGAQAAAEVVEADPYDAVAAVLDRGEADELIVCTLPPGLSRWLGADLVQRLRRRTDLPLTHIVAPAGMPERFAAQAIRLTIFVGESDRHGHTPLYSEIVRRAREAGLSGATALRGVEGFGASSVIHTTRLLTMSEDLPMVVVIIDAPERIDAFLPHLDELIGEGLVVREQVEVIKYAGRIGSRSQAS